MKPLLPGAALLAIAVATGIAACSSRPTDQAPSPPESASGGEQTGEVGYELRLGRTTHINKASYSITCPGGFAQSGTIDVTRLREIEGSIPNLPPGGPCTLTVTATSTNGNVSCSGSASGLTVNCPGNRSRDETHLKLTCTRNHVGREWGDNDWKENARTFQLGAEVNLVCAMPDGGDACVPSTCAAYAAAQGFPRACGILSDGCTGTLDCGSCATGVPCGVPGIPNVCECLPLTTCPAGDNCGTVPDGCGGTINCGACVAPGVCTLNRCEVCNVTCAQLGANCGVVPDGCGGALDCGTCTSPETCGGGGVANHCGAPDGCAPVTTCPAGQTCGTAPDGCGGLVACGNCVAPDRCVIAAGQTAGTCNPDLCDPTNPATTTLTCFQQQDNAPHNPPPTPPTLCSTCVTSNGCFDPTVLGGTCEMVTGNANLLAGTVGDGGPTCAQVFSPLTPPISERSVCLDVLSTIFTSHCADTFMITPCLCGTTDPAQCTAGAATPNGPAYDEYACDFGTTKGVPIFTIAADFVVPTFGAGMANSIAECAAVFGCDCF